MNFRLGTCGRIHALETGQQSGAQLSIMPGLSTHLVQELNAVSVYDHLPYHPSVARRHSRWPHTQRECRLPVSPACSSR